MNMVLRCFIILLCCLRALDDVLGRMWKEKLYKFDATKLYYLLLFSSTCWWIY